jgi:hypothetical protein
MSTVAHVESAVDAHVPYRHRRLRAISNRCAVRDIERLAGQGA